MTCLTRSFLTPCRADRATAASDIVVRVASDDLRHFTTAVAHQMSVYAPRFSAATFFMGPAQLSRRACTEVRGQF